MRRDHRYASAGHYEERGVVDAARPEHVERHITPGERALAPQRLGQAVRHRRACLDPRRLGKDGQREDARAGAEPAQHQTSGAPQTPERRPGRLYMHAVASGRGQRFHQGSAQLLGRLKALGGILGERAVDHGP